MSFKVEKVNELPGGKRVKSKLYDDIIADVSSKQAGIYCVTVENKKTSTLYQQLGKRLKDNKTLKLHKRGENIYIEKLAKK